MAEFTPMKSTISDDVLDLLFKFKMDGGKLIYGINGNPVAYNLPYDWDYDISFFKYIDKDLWDNIDIIQIKNKLNYCIDYIPKIKNPEQNLCDAEAMGIIEDILQDVLDIICKRFTPPNPSK